VVVGRDALPADALILGDAAESHGDFLSGDGREFGDPRDGEARALTVARLGAAKFRASGADDVHALAPVYLRLSEAEERLSTKEGG